MKRQNGSLFFSLLLSFAVMVIGSIFSRPDENWYHSLIRPFWTPPGFILSIVWPILYAMIGLSLWQVLSLQREAKKGRALLAFSVQLFLNLTWTFSFFYLQSPLLGLINIALLDVAIFWNIWEFRQLSIAAAYLLFPYFLWVLFATTLNFGFWVFNR